VEWDCLNGSRVVARDDLQSAGKDSRSVRAKPSSPPSRSSPLQGEEDKVGIYYGNDPVRAYGESLPLTGQAGWVYLCSGLTGNPTPLDLRSRLMTGMGLLIWTRRSASLQFPILWKSVQSVVKTSQFFYVFFSVFRVFRGYNAPP
jgi:hypothetical protein